VASCFKKFAKRAQNESEVKLKKIRSDNGKEFETQTLKLIVMGSSMRLPQHILSTKMV
jgi:hypothetical protein